MSFGIAIVILSVETVMNKARHEVIAQFLVGGAVWVKAMCRRRDLVLRVSERSSLEPKQIKKGTQ
eukprot:6273501-Amphidinium_carterae.1